MSLIIYLCSPVKTSAAHSFTCVYGPTENVQNKATILTARRKYYELCLRYNSPSPCRVLRFKVLRDSYGQKIAFVRFCSWLVKR